MLAVSPTLVPENVAVEAVNIVPDFILAVVTNVT